MDGDFGSTHRILYSMKDNGRKERVMEKAGVSGTQEKYMKAIG